MLSAFDFNLNHPIIPGDIVVGKFDGKHPCLAMATTANKVLIHSPHTRALNAEIQQSLDVDSSVIFDNILVVCFEVCL